MPVKQKKNRKYEPPLVKEIGGVFEQAMGASQCVTGGTFQTGDCPGGSGAQTGCPGGFGDQSCSGGGSDQGGCGGGVGVSGGGCETGWGN